MNTQKTFAAILLALIACVVFGGADDPCAECSGVPSEGQGSTGLINRAAYHPFTAKRPDGITKTPGPATQGLCADSCHHSGI